LEPDVPLQYSYFLAVGSCFDPVSFSQVMRVIILPSVQYLSSFVKYHSLFETFTVMMTTDKCMEDTKWVLRILVYAADFATVDLLLESRVGGILLAYFGHDAY